VQEGRHPWRTRFAALAVTAATFALLLATGPRLAMVWDEGYTLGREARIRLWFQALRDPPGFAAKWQPPHRELVQPDRPDAIVPPPSPSQIATRSGLFSPRVLAWFWPFGREEPHGHPPLYAIVGLIGDVIVPGWPILERARLGPMLVFSLAAGAIFGVFARRVGPRPAALATGAWVLQPRLFAHAHYATYDALLTSLWVGAILAFALAVEPRTDRRSPRWWWVLLFGLLCGWAADTKLTGWFLPLPFLAWTILYRDRRAAWTLLVGGIVGVVTLYAFNPPWWPDAIGGVRRFLASNLSRGRTIPIESLFLGRIYKTPIDSLPWYNTLVWTVFITPVGFLAFALAGAWTALAALLQRARDWVPRVRSAGSASGTPALVWRDRLTVLAVGHWAFLLLLRALPHTPGHDAERQFLPAFGCLALVAGLGSAWIVDRWGRGGKALIAAALAEGAISLLVMMPVPLSYYSPLVGGLPGATRLGMEPTYYWDALDEHALAWLDANTPPGRSVLFATNPTSWFYLRDSGRLRVPLAPFEPGLPAWYVVQNRPGALRPLDRALIARLGPRYVLTSRLGVPLVWAFPFEFVESAKGAAR
jgi:4-amino-4-deoxy-L-arabinose transferase-like glycosyltransferase